MSINLIRVKHLIRSIKVWIKTKVSALFLRTALFIGKIYWQTMPHSEKPVPDLLYPYNLSLAGRRRLASGKLASMVPILIRESSPSTLGGVPSWLLDFATDERPFVPPLDIVFPRQALIFSFAPNTHYKPNSITQPITSLDSIVEQGYSSPIPGADRNLLEDLFSRRLNLGTDPIPLIPIFCDAEEILSATSLDTLSLIINRCWQESLKWCLSQMPPLPPVSEEAIESQVGTGNWIDRRVFIEEATFSALFQLGNDAKVVIK